MTDFSTFHDYYYDYLAFFDSAYVLWGKFYVTPASWTADPCLVFAVVFEFSFVFPFVATYWAFDHF